jgi:hypothetical protein
MKRPYDQFGKDAVFAGMAATPFYSRERAQVNVIVRLLLLGSNLQEHDQGQAAGADGKIAYRRDAMQPRKLTP